MDPTLMIIPIVHDGIIYFWIESLIIHNLKLYFDICIPYIVME